jgi:hypothetical protein
MEFTDVIMERGECEEEFKKVKSKLKWKEEKNVEAELKRSKDERRERQKEYKLSPRN